MAGWGLPYQGSKGAHAGKIYRAISQRHPDSQLLWEPFTGGGAVGAYFATHGWDVEASDAERYVVALLREATINSPLRDPVKSARIYRWVTREEFFAAVKRPESLGLPDWEIGFIRIFWSFGNSQTSYLYGKHLEPIKKAGTNLIVLQEPQPFLNDIFPVSQQEKIAELPTVFARYRALQKAVRTLSGNKRRIEHVERLASLDNINRVERLASLRFHHRSYKQVFDDLLNMESPQVVYCDPPYASTAGYASAGSFNSAEFWEAAQKLVSAGHHVYVSEYTAPEPWKPILSFPRPENAGPKAKRDIAIERLFTMTK